MVFLKIPSPPTNRKKKEKKDGRKNKTKIMRKRGRKGRKEEGQREGTIN